MRFLQSEVAECGLICLAYASDILGAKLDPVELRRRFPISSRGLSFKELSAIATALDMSARPVKCELDELSGLKCPAILHWGMNHYVVLEKRLGNRFVIHDPSAGRTTLSKEQISLKYTGVALELSTAGAFIKRKEKSPLSLLSWVKFSGEIRSGLIQIIILSVLMQIYVVGSPFYVQLAIDQAALKGDADLLASLAVGFGAFAIFNLIATGLRSLASQYLSALLSWDMGQRLFRHLMRLPLPWFQRRRLADTISRIDALNPIRDLITGALVTALIDGGLAITTLCAMFVFAPGLTAISLLGTALCIGLRFASLPKMLRLSSELLSAQLAENGRRIESVRAINTIKAMGGEDRQETQWSNRFADTIRQSFLKSRYQVTISSLSQGVDALITVTIVYFAALLIAEHRITVGIFYAFMAYRSQFNTASTSVTEQSIQWRLSDIYSYRLADIVLTPPEPSEPPMTMSLDRFAGAVEVDGITFRYSPQEPFVLKNVTLTVGAGEFLAIVGPSGVGKSTLLKILCGLYDASGGEVRIDGRPISAWGQKLVRRHCGVVLQDDDLLIGSIAENVSFFDENIDLDKVWNALETVAMRDEVLAMPMKLETRVGDGGTMLSGGQKQRLLLARALYKNPSILILDEATSHLDVANEKKIGANLRAMNITRIVVAHRLETINTADKIFDLSLRQYVHLPKMAASQH